MNILVVSQYFWPEPFIINDLVIALQQQGHNITVYTGKPNYPDGNLYPGYSSAHLQEEQYHKDIAVFRVPLRPRKTSGAKNLALNYLSFICSGLWHAKRFCKNKHFDSILVFAPSPITSAIPALWLKKLTKSHLSIWIQDLWPESLQATGYINNPWILNRIKSLVIGIYRRADTLLVQSQAFIPEVAKLAPNKDIVYYPNSAKDHVSLAEQQVALNPTLENLLNEHFCVVFAGNIGSAQAVETIVEAALELQAIPELKLVLVGSGSQSNWVAEQINKHQLNNLILAGRFPSSDMPYIFSKASALLVTLKKEDIFRFTIPSKIQTYLAAAKPLIASLDGEGARVVLEAGCGYTSEAQDSKALANNIKKMYHLPSLERDHMGKSGRAYFLEHFEMESQSQRLIDIIERRITKRNPAP